MDFGERFNSKMTSHNNNVTQMKLTVTLLQSHELH